MSTVEIFGMRCARPEQIEADASATVKLVRNHLPHFEPMLEPDYQHGWWTVKLACPPTADYQFSLHGELLGERQISAELVGEGIVRSRNRFWYSPMELADFHNDASEVERAFHERVEGLLTCPTRIIQNKGVMLLGYDGEYRAESGWQSLGGITYLGFGLGIPFVGKEHIYTSPPIRSCTRE